MVTAVNIAEVITLMERMMSEDGKENVCIQILDIMREYHDQDARGYVDTPGGLEHMGDVWRLFKQWEREILGE